MPGPMKPDELARYADLIVEGCIALRRGDTVIALANPEQRELVVALAEAAYRRGAVFVESIVDDARLTAARVTHGSDEAGSSGCRRRATPVTEKGRRVTLVRDGLWQM